MVLPTSLAQLEECMAKMIEWLEQILAYVNGVLGSGRLPSDPVIGRKLMELVNLASTQLRPEKLESMVKMVSRPANQLI